jgi:hypothetical protein
VYESLRPIKASLLKVFVGLGIVSWRLNSGFQVSQVAVCEGGFYVAFAEDANLGDVFARESQAKHGNSRE